MMVKPKKQTRLLEDEEIQRLLIADESSDALIQPFRDKRRDALAEFLGSNYGDQGTEELRPDNLMQFNTLVYLRTLSAGTPQGLFTTESQPLKSVAIDLEIATNRVSRLLGVGKTINTAVFDALYGIGIVKHGRDMNPADPLRGFSKVGGQPYADTVDFDDFCWDAQARTWKDVTFMRNRYRMPLRDAKSNPLFDEKLRSELQPTRKKVQQDTGETKVEQFSRGDQWDFDEVEDFVELKDFYLPHRGICLTIADGQDKPLREWRWKGPRKGPYLLLTFIDVPSQLMPLAPALTWLDLHILENELMHKAADQALRQKTVTFVPHGAQRDGKRVQQAEDGDMIGVDMPGAIQEGKYGGADSGTLLMSTQVRQLSNARFGNPEVLAGVGPQSTTFGQDRLIAEAANRMVASMQAIVLEFAADVLQAIAWYILNDRFIDLPLSKGVDGTDISVPFRYTADRSRGDLLDYEIKIDPYSMQHLSPAQRLASLSQLMTEFVLPGQPLIQQQNGSIDFQKFLQIFSRYSGLPEVGDLIQFSTAEPQQYSTGAQQAPAKPAVTTRNYNRRSAPGPGPSSEDAVAAALMAAVQRGGQRGQMAKAGSA